MLTYLLKSALPFTLTFVIGAALGVFLNPFSARSEKCCRAPRTELHDYSRGKGHSCKHRRFKGRELVAETKPLVILFKPSARWFPVYREYRDYVRVRVTFGSDGKVQGVEHLNPLLPSAMLEDVERAARGIQFTPETINGLSVSVTKETDIYFALYD